MQLYESMLESISKKAQGVEFFLFPLCVHELMETGNIKEELINYWTLILKLFGIKSRM